MREGAPCMLHISEVHYVVGAYLNLCKFITTATVYQYTTIGLIMQVVSYYVCVNIHLPYYVLYGKVYDNASHTRNTKFTRDYILIYYIYVYVVYYYRRITLERCAQYTVIRYRLRYVCLLPWDVLMLNVSIFVACASS